MDRRIFISAVTCGLLTAEFIVRAQGATTVRRLGVLAEGTLPNPAELDASFRPLRELGWVEGKNLVVERRYSNGGAEHLRVLAQELVRLKVDVIAAFGTNATLAAKEATSTIPI